MMWYRIQKKIIQIDSMYVRYKVQKFITSCKFSYHTAMHFCFDYKYISV